MFFPRNECVLAYVYWCLFDTCLFPVTRFLCLYLTRVRCLLPDFCVFTWNVSVACCQISVWLLDTCPFPVTRFLCVYLTRVRCLLPDFCAFNWHVSVACYQNSSVEQVSSICDVPVLWPGSGTSNPHFLWTSFCFLLIFCQVVIQWTPYHSTWYRPSINRCLLSSM
jgi:hypothetical protein